MVVVKMNPMDVLAVIPARYGSKRFPGKPLFPIAGKPLIQWVIENAQSSPSISDLIVATDDEKIQSCVSDLGVKCVMTDSDLPSGTDRIWAACKDLNFDVVINVQGDEPLITAEMLEALISCFNEDVELQMATLASPLDNKDLQNKNAVKVILNQFSEAIYFSRFAIPYSREESVVDPLNCFKHIGLYAYKKEFLEAFCSEPACELEKAESLEQLRALYLGARIKVKLVEHLAPGVDTPEDAKRVEEILTKKA